MTPETLSELGYKMLTGAEHWETLGNYDKAIACHQAAALYFQACAAFTSVPANQMPDIRPVNMLWEWELEEKKSARGTGRSVNGLRQSHRLRASGRIIMAKKPRKPRPGY